MKLMTRAQRVTTLASVLFVLAACNGQRVEDCRPPCDLSPRFEVAFDQCVADGLYGTGGAEECRPGNRRCCAEATGCVGSLRDQVVTGPIECASTMVAVCNECGDREAAGYLACLADGTSFDCSSGDLQCCAGAQSCLGILGSGSTTIAIGSTAPCCGPNGECLRGEFCDGLTLECVAIACAGSACSYGLTCIDDECVCAGPGVRCPFGETCVDDVCVVIVVPECVDDGDCAFEPGLTCVAGECVCAGPGARCPPGETCVDGECLVPECLDDIDCALDEMCDLPTHLCVPRACAMIDEDCDGLDDDCDGVADDDFVESGVLCGVGVCQNEGVLTCPAGAVEPLSTCLPLSPTGLDDNCDGLDDDCNGTVDDGCEFCGDGVMNGAEECDGTDFGTASCFSLGYDTGTLRCLPSMCMIDSSGCRCAADSDSDLSCDRVDCDPFNESIYPGAMERCDGWDNDCDLMVDEGPEPDLYCSSFSFCDVWVCMFGECGQSGGPGTCGDDGNECTIECDESAMMCVSELRPFDYPCLGGSGFCDGSGMCVAG